MYYAWKKNPVDWMNGSDFRGKTVGPVCFETACISDTFPMTNGVRQGIPISPRLVSSRCDTAGAKKRVQDTVIMSLNHHRSGHPKNVDQYTDDIAFF